MDALTVLRREHTRIGQLFVEFDALPERARNGRKALMDELDALVRRHIEIEDALIYQKIATAPEWNDDRITLVHSQEEHRLVVALLDQVAETDCHSDAYIARVRILRDVLLRHIAEEEEQIFSVYAGSHAA
jgi:hemerythrin-like domain-containing protein